MEFTTKTFDELSCRELYELLRARQDVFVVEQNCPYADLDGRDQGSLHVFSADETGTVTACLRLFRRAGEPDTVQMGRVLTRRRGEGLGAAVLKEGIRKARDCLNARQIFLEAQSYAAAFYAREGFQICGEEFLEDGIPHVPMRLIL